MAEEGYPKIGHFEDVAAFRGHLARIGVELPVEEGVLSAGEGSPMGRPLEVDGFRVGNRWVVHPMEGWDGTTGGEPTEHTVRRWRHFGESGCKWVWGGEAFTVRGDGRANPNQIGLIEGDENRAERGLRLLLETLTGAHREKFGSADDLLVGLQLTHSGRFCRPVDKKQLRPRIAYHHPVLDRKFGIAGDDDSVVLKDWEIEEIIESYVAAARIAQRVGFGFVDVKQCHGYLGHEMLSAFTREGKYGGSLENRTRFAREIIEGIRAACPGMKIGVRLSVFDGPPFRPDPNKGGMGKLGPGIPEEVGLPYYYGFGCKAENPLEMDLREPIEYIRMLSGMGVKMINASCASPYYNPHYVRPATFPPSDGYQPPEDPLVGVARQVRAVREIKEACPEVVMVGTGYTYLQEYLPQVAQGVVRKGWVDAVGVGRMVLSYWEMAADTLAGRGMQVKRICRTFSDCTTGPRNGLISGCFPLDPYYKEGAAHAELKLKKAELRKALTVVK